MDAAQTDKPQVMRGHEQYLPKEHLDFPRESKEIPAHAEHGHPTHHAPHLQSSYENPYQVETLLSWNAPGRPFRKRGKEFFATGLLITLLVEIILFLFSQYLLMLLVASLLFVAFALASTPPHNVRYTISTEGITIEDHFFLWQELYDFYFKNREGADVLHVRTRAMIPGELTIPLDRVSRDDITQAMLPFLPYREVVKKTFMEKSGDWLSRNFPLENPRTQKE